MATLARSAREMARHWLYRLGLRPTSDAAVTGSVAERFATIYAERHWQTGADVPLSGAGSTLAATAALRDALPGLLTELGCTTLLDVGCGDFTWMQHLDLPCQYIGADVVPAVVAANTAAFANDRRRFIELDATAEPLPAADVILCREVLFHLSFADGARMLANFARSGARWVLLTTDRATRFNSDIETGGARIVNLEMAPYRLGPPDRLIAEPLSYEGRAIGLWPMARLAGNS